MANRFLQNRDLNASSIGKNWIFRFITQQPKLRIKYACKYNYQRALCENTKIIEDWFKLVYNFIAKYGILKKDIYNFNKIGFLIGQIGTIIVVINLNKAKSPKLA